MKVALVRRDGVTPGAPAGTAEACGATGLTAADTGAERLLSGTTIGSSIATISWRRCSNHGGSSSCMPN